MNKHLRAILLLLVTCSILPAIAQEVWVDFNETTFPDPLFRQELIAIEKKMEGYNYQRPVIEGDRIRVDNVKTLALGEYNITNLTGIKYFLNLNSLILNNKPQGTLKYLDLSGLKNLTTLQLAPGGNNSTIIYTQSSNQNVVLETLILDNTGIDAIYAQRLPKLKHISVKGCKNLTTIMAPSCDLMGLDLSDCPNITTVVAENNTNMTYLKVPENAYDLKMVDVDNTKINRFDPPKGCNYGSNQYVSFSFDNTKISDLDMSGYAGKSFSQIRFDKSALKCLALSKLSSINLINGSSSTINLGYVDSFKVHEPDALGASESVSNVSGGTYDRNTGIITFNAGSNKVTYKFTCKAKSGSAKTVSVTATRETAPLTLHIETTPTIQSQLAGNTDGFEPMKFQLYHVGDNTYEATIPLFYGNFEIVQTKENGTEQRLGANSAQTTLHHIDLSRGYVYVESGNEYALHAHQTQIPDKVDNVARSQQPHFYYTTHPNELEQNGLGLRNAKISVHYINGEPAGTLTVTGGTTTAIDEIEIDNNDTSIAGDEGVEAEYYTLQGVKVGADALTPGFYICRRGAKATKVIIR